MFKQQHYLVQLIASLFLLQPLSLQAQSTTSPASTVPTTALCESLRGQTAGVDKRLDEYSNLVRGRNCTLLNADQTRDMAELINRIPENTVILLSSNTATPTMTPSPSTASPLLDKISVKYGIENSIVLKDGQDIIGAADEGFDIVITLRPNYRLTFMIWVGATDNFNFGETKDSHISHITFLSDRPMTNEDHIIIIGAACSNRRLIVENNVFRLPRWVAVYLDCKKPLDASIDPTQSGPGLRFANNTVIGNNIMPTTNGIPAEAVFIHLPAIKNQSQRLEIIGNTLQGKMADAAEFILGSGTSVNIYRNKVNISNSGIASNNHRWLLISRRGGFVLTGHTENNAERPLFNLAGNQIQVTETALIVKAPIELAFACNHLQGHSPWRQIEEQFSLKAADPFLLRNECERLTPSSSVVTASPAPYAINQTINTWTAIKGSTATACSGLINLEDHLYFDSEVCPVNMTNYAFVNNAVSSTFSNSSSIINSSYVINSSSIINSSYSMDSSISKVPTSSVGKAIVDTGFGIIITLALLLIL
ncbi:hypothetical protein [Endozoicomonas sp. 2B-B]